LKKKTFFFFKHSLSRKQQNKGQKTTITKNSSICVICQIFLICKTTKLKFFLSIPFQEDNKKQRDAKQNNKTRKTKAKKNSKNLPTLKCEMQTQGLERKNTTL